MTDAADSNAEDLFPLDKISDDAGHERELKPWHKPRKQWIRANQWAAIVRTLAEDLNLTDRPFKYLTLPGEDMFDIRVLHDVCEQKNTELKFLGFDSRRRTNVNIAYDEVLRMPFTHKSSHLIEDRVEEICQAESLAEENAKEYCGFDVINLDFCDSVGGREAGTPYTHLEALRKIIRLQTDGRAEPWVLFVTTRCDRNSVKQSVRDSLADLVLGNVSDHETFDRRIKAEPFKLSADEIANERSGLESLDEHGHMFTFAVGLSKWLIRLSMSAWIVKQETTAGYRVSDDAELPDMLSLAFRFERIQPSLIDETGLVKPRANEPCLKEPEELPLVHVALDQYRDMVDVDWLLHSDDKLCETVVLQNAELMANARYNYNEVVAWSRENVWHPPDGT